MECSLLLQIVKILFLVSIYYVFSISITFYNKWILTGYPFPVSITMVHLIVKFLLAWFIRKVVSCVTKHPPLILDWKEYLRHIAPIAIFSALDIGLSNWSLLFITISLYTMSKSTALIFILFFSLLLRLEKPRVSLVAVVMMIVIGLFLFTYKSTSFDVEGFILVISASIITGLRWSTAQLALHKEDLGLSNPIDIVFHLQPIMIITLLPLSVPVDGTAIGTSMLVFRASSAGEFGWTVLFILPAALLAFMLGISEYLLVYHTSGLTLSISGVFKEIIVLTLSIMWWEEDSLTTINIVGIVICVGGISLHVLLKALCSEAAEKENASLSKDKEDMVELIPKSKRHSSRSEKEESVGVASESDSNDSVLLLDTSRL